MMYIDVYMYYVIFLLYCFTVYLFCAAERFDEIIQDLHGPPGPQGVGRPGRQGNPGPQGVVGMHVQSQPIYRLLKAKTRAKCMQISCQTHAIQHMYKFLS